MAIEKMSLVSIIGNESELDEALLHSIESECFHIELTRRITGDNNDFASAAADNPYIAPLQKLINLSIELSIPLHKQDYKRLDLTNRQITEYLDGIDSNLNIISRDLNEAKEELSKMEISKSTIEHLLGLNISFDDLFSLKHIKIRFGLLPSDNYEKLAYYENRSFFFFPFDNDGTYCWGLYLAPATKADSIDSIFNSLSFERIRLPDYLHGTPNQSLINLKKQIEIKKDIISDLEQKIQSIREKESDKLLAVFTKLKCQNEICELRKYVSILHNKFLIVGYIPERKVEEFSALFDPMLTTSCVIDSVESVPSLTPPTKLKNNRFAEPFQGFVEMYGLPSYKGIDPTMLVAVTYTLLFGIMFGDLGQGILLSIIGMLMWKLKKMYLGRIIARCGIFSAVFGCVYGSVFGYEHLLDGVYKAIGFAEKPVEVFDSSTTNILLLGAVGIGCVLIIISMAVNIVLGIRNKDSIRALFGSNGLAGLVLYVSAIAAAVLLMMFNINVLNPLFIIICIVIPLIIMFSRELLEQLVKLKKIKKPENGIGGFIIENFFEVFEFVLSYITNTMSFLRVGGFILSHAGMMAVVMTLSEMVGSGASWAVVIIGNLFVMAMEGLIVGIQVLRLEFYEIFSRFYDGDGRPFKAVEVSYDINNQ